MTAILNILIQYKLFYTQILKNKIKETYDKY